MNDMIKAVIICMVIFVLILLIPGFLKFMETRRKNGEKIKYNKINIFFILLYLLVTISVIVFSIKDLNASIELLKEAAKLTGTTVKQSKIDELNYRFFIELIIKIVSIFAYFAITHYFVSMYFSKKENV